MAKRKSDKMSIPAGEGIVFSISGTQEQAYAEMPYCQDQGPSAPNIKWADLIAKGESPRGFRSETANGTASDQGAGWNRNDYSYRRPQVSDDGPWKGNRTGE